MKTPDVREERPLECERKFVGVIDRRDAALALLRQYCLPDPKHPVGVTESIYFDDPHYTSYWEKLDGDSLKRKCRIRWYAKTGPPTQERIPAFLEIKDRLGAGREKFRQSFDADHRWLETAPLHDPAFMMLLAEQLARAHRVAMPGLQPALSIRYHRHRFVCPETGARLCVDAELSSPRVNEAWLPARGVLRSAHVVCEAKSSTHRAWAWLAPLRRLGFQCRSYSKYGEFMERRLNGGE